MPVASLRADHSTVALPTTAVGEVETAWAQQLGQERFADFRSLLLELNQLA
jgi:hypothetical protein